jgi:predicted transcriptional regulator
MIDFACKQFNLRDIIKCSLGLTKGDLAVFEHLVKRNGRHRTEEIAHALKVDTSTVQRAVKKLHEKQLLRRTQMNLEGGGYVYVYEANDKRAIRRIIMEIVQSWTKRVEKELETW